MNVLVVEPGYLPYEKEIKDGADHLEQMQAIVNVSFFIVSIRHEWGHTNYGLRERLNGIQEVSGSIPLISTKKETVTITQIAKRMHLSENSVSVTLHRLRAALRAHLEERGFTV